MKETAEKVVFISFLACIAHILFLSFGPVTGFGPWVSESFLAFLIMPVSAFFIGLDGLLSLPSREQRSKGFQALIIAFSLLMLFIPLGIASNFVGFKLRSWGFLMTAKRAEPLVAAIKQYQENTGSLPKAADDLIPEYLSKMPYGLPPLIIESHDGNWTLGAFVSIGFLNFDSFFYQSDQKYEDDEAYEHLGDWVYLHE